MIIWLKTLFFLPFVKQCEAVIVEAIKASIYKSAKELLLWPLRTLGQWIGLMAEELASVYADVLDSTGAAYELTSAKTAALAFQKMPLSKRTSFTRKIFKGPLPRDFFLEPWGYGSARQNVDAVQNQIRVLYIVSYVTLGIGFAGVFMYSILWTLHREKRSRKKLPRQKRPRSSTSLSLSVTREEVQRRRETEESRERESSGSDEVEAQTQRDSNDENVSQSHDEDEEASHRVEEDVENHESDGPSIGSHESEETAESDE